MIEFFCSGCGKKYTVGLEFAGRRGRCRQCNTEFVAPAAPRQAPQQQATPHQQAMARQPGPLAPPPPPLSTLTPVATRPAPSPFEGLAPLPSLPAQETEYALQPLVPSPYAPPPFAPQPYSQRPFAPSQHVPQPQPFVPPSRPMMAFPPAAPQPAMPPAPQPVLHASAQARASVRTRRLEADLAQVQAAFARSTMIRVTPLSGQPPEAYRVDYAIRGLERGSGGQPSIRQQHSVEMRLTLDYPRQSPRCKMLTPIFHPNIEPAMICVGDHWTAGERLIDLIVRIGEMIAYQAYNIKSPLDGEAAMWADLNRMHLPVDNRNLHPLEG